MEDDDSEQRSSDEEERESVEDLKKADVKLAQLKKIANKKRTHGTPMSRLEGLQSMQEMMKAHAFQRMKDGLRKILSLHTAVELSSVCGCLQLKTQQKASTSLDLIMKYASETEEINEEKMKKILSFLWEGALWEYLHSVGHPTSTMLIDPKITILKLWESGGFLEGMNNFIPHFISREVKKRNDWITSEDIQVRIEKIQKAQDSAKLAERKILSDHDYTNILSYFNQMSNLRSLENNVREYLISELEIARSRIDSYEESSIMVRDQCSELEKKFIQITEVLNNRLGYMEDMYEREIQKNLSLESYLCRMNGVLDSYLETEENRQQIGGGTLQAFKLKNLEEECDFEVVKEISCKLQTYRDQRNDCDNQLRKKCRTLVDNINVLTNDLHYLQERYDYLTKQYEKSIEDLTKLTKTSILTERTFIKQLEIQKYQKQISWNLTSSYSSKINFMKNEHLKIKPILLSSCLSTIPLLRKIGYSLLLSINGMIGNEEEHSMIQENMKMNEQDLFSKQLEIYEKERLYKLSLLAKTPKSGKGGKAIKGSEKGKRPGSRGDDQTVKSKMSEDGTKSPGKKATGKGAKPTPPGSAKGGREKENNASSTKKPASVKKK
jgi:hypothetical protein